MQKPNTNKGDGSPGQNKQMREKVLNQLSTASLDSAFCPKIKNTQQSMINTTTKNMSAGNSANS